MSNATKTLVELLRYMTLDHRNNSEKAMIALMGQAADEIERLSRPWNEREPPMTKDQLYAAIQSALDCIDFPRENDALVVLCDIEKILKAALAADRAADKSAELWQALIADCNKEPCDYPCLRDDLGDWLLDMAGRYPTLNDYARSYVNGTPDDERRTDEPHAARCQCLCPTHGGPMAEPKP